MANGQDVFEATTIPVPGCPKNTRRAAALARCSECGHTESIQSNARKGASAPELTEKLFRRRGWKMANRRSRDLCPTCNSAQQSTPRYAETVMGAKMIEAQNRKTEEAFNKGVSVIRSAADARRERAVSTIQPSLAVEPGIVPETPASSQAEETPMQKLDPKLSKRIRAHQAGMITMAKAWMAAQDVVALRNDNRAKPGETQQDHLDRLTKRMSDLQTQRDALIKDLESLKPKRGRPPKQASTAKPAVAASKPKAAVAAVPAVPEKAPVVAPGVIPDVEVLGMPPVEPISLEAVLTPTQQQRRTIRDALDEHYDEDAQMYRGGESDRSMGERLKLPAAMVALLREAMGLGPDRNNAQQTYRAELESMAEELREVSKAEEQLVLRIAGVESKMLSHIESEVKRLHEEAKAALAGELRPLTAALAEQEQRRVALESRVDDIRAKLR